jgi:hypothetical protein
MKLLKPDETEPQGHFMRPKKSHEFSDHERMVILEMAKGAGRKIETMSESELAKTIERFGNMRSHCTDPENFPQEVVQVFEGMYTVPAFLMFERFDNQFIESLQDDRENDAD